MSDPRLSPRVLVPLLVVLTAIGPMALNLPLPAVPALARYFDADPGIVQLTITLYLAGMACAQLVHGPLSDRYGRRPVMICALIITGSMSLAAAAATSIGWLIVARVLQSLGASAGLVVGRAVIRDVFDRDRSASMIGWVTMAMVVAPMLSPSIGGLLNETVGWRWIFVATAGVTALALAAAFFGLPETRATVSSPTISEIFRDARLLMTDRNFLGYLGIGAVSSVTFFAFVGGAPHVVVTVMGESSTSYGLWFIANAGGYMVGNAVSGRYSMRVGGDRLIAWGCVLMIIAALVQSGIAFSGWMTHPAMLFLPQAGIAFANGLQLPAAVAGAVSVNPHAVGSASGIVGFSQMGLGAIAAQIAGSLVGAYVSATPMVVMVLIAAVGTWACTLLLKRQDA
ncbi:multidrug effflux MFS transporter [Phreatobacter stygius]|uniref:Bcr/CflA family efflux transporter n=1 Tax=Phreatobacter stygius TaxID=1940610 RepID=A0A4D7B6B9_9HYPH|nr:multidrug effflux MFS transporter [Phreatobacter stygius]QCI66645.1 multidrug effflux MFS transporter [Phreatobacter stygius]